MSGFLVFERASNGRSACHVTGERISKGEWIVGLRGGRSAVKWQKPLAFLKACLIEYSVNTGAMCRATGRKLLKGEPRIVCTTGSSRMYLSVEGAGKLLNPILGRVSDEFQPEELEGLASLAQPDKEAVLRSLATSADAVLEFDSSSPEPCGSSDSHDSRNSRKRQKMDNTTNALKVDNKQNVEPQLTEFEKQRNAQIERNRKVLNSLKLPTMDSWSKPLNRFAPKKKPKKPLPLPPASRKSLRQQGKAPDGSRPADGNEENASPKVASLSDPTASKPRHNMELIGFESLNGAATSDAEFLKVLARGGGPSRGRKEGLSAAGLWALTLREEDVGKVTRAAAVVMGFQDRHDNLVVAGGDKLGHVGLWRIGPDGQKGQQREEGTGRDVDSDEDDDSILMFAPHTQMLCGLKWVGGSGQASALLTASYDGSVRKLDVIKGQWLLSHSSPDREYSAFECSNDGTTGYIADKDGFFEVLDLRTNSTTQGCILHNKKVNALELDHQEERLIVSASTDTTVSVWDIRQLGKQMKPVATTMHLKSCHGARFAPAGAKRVLTTSFDNTLRIWDLATDAYVSIHHNNNTGRWLSPFKAIWTPAGDAVLVGGMHRTVDVFHDSSIEAGQISSPYMSAIPCRLCLHPQLPVLAAATGSGRIHMFRS